MQTHFFRRFPERPFRHFWTSCSKGRLDELTRTTRSNQRPSPNIVRIREEMVGPSRRFSNFCGCNPRVAGGGTTLLSLEQVSYPQQDSSGPLLVLRRILDMIEHYIFTLIVRWDLSLASRLEESALIAADPDPTSPTEYANSRAAGSRSSTFSNDEGYCICRSATPHASFADFLVTDFSVRTAFRTGTGIACDISSAFSPSSLLNSLRSSS